MIVLQYLKKQIWIINVFFVIASAYLTANMINLHISDKIDTAPKIDLVSRSQDLSSAKIPIEDYDVVLNRNIFNSASVIQEGLKNLAFKLGMNLTLTDLDLIGTMAGAPELSLALISQKSQGNKVEIYRWGSNVGDYIIKSIERRQVLLEKDGAEEILKMPEDRQAFAFNKSSKVENIADGIKKVGDDEMVVDRSVIDSSFENFGKLMRQARVVPSIEAGKIQGFKIYRIKDKSLFQQIGLLNGDIIHRVNGNEISGPEDALKLFEIFKTAKTITIDLNRKKVKKTLTYTVR